MSRTQGATLPHGYYVIEYEGTRVISRVPQRTEYAMIDRTDFVTFFRNKFSIPAQTKLKFYTTEIAQCYGKKVEIPDDDELWESLLLTIKVVGAEKVENADAEVRESVVVDPPRVTTGLRMESAGQSGRAGWPRQMARSYRGGGF